MNCTVESEVCTSRALLTPDGVDVIVAARGQRAVEEPQRGREPRAAPPGGPLKVPRQRRERVRLRGLGSIVNSILKHTNISLSSVVDF